MGVVYSKYNIIAYIFIMRESAMKIIIGNVDATTERK